MQADWMQLSSDIWLGIFQLLQPNPEEAEEDPEIDFKMELWQFYELSEVCQKFHRLCTQHRSLRSCLFLPSYFKFEADSLPGMYQWIQRHADSVQTIYAHSGSPYIEAALAVLQAHRRPSIAAPITNIHLSNPEAYNRLPGSVLLLVAQFKTVTTCTLEMELTSSNLLGPTFDLYALSSMHHLVNLKLANATFVDLGAASRLTCLSLQRAKVGSSEDCLCVTSLVALDMFQAAVQCLHAEGVTACSSLQQLTCLDSYILASNPAEHLSCGKNELMRIPASLSRLTNLVSLTFAYTHNTAEIDMGWLGQLPSLHSVGASLDVSVATFPDDLSVLSKLTELSVGSWIGNGMYRFSLDWSKLFNLCSLLIRSALQLNESFVCLAALPSLKEVVLELKRSDAPTTVQVALLAHQLGTTRPDVQLSMKSG